MTDESFYKTTFEHHWFIDVINYLLKVLIDTKLFHRNIVYRTILLNDLGKTFKYLLNAFVC